LTFHHARALKIEILRYWVDAGRTVEGTLV